jgi:hypothetical protein
LRGIGAMNNETISVSKCEIEIFTEKKPYRGKPSGDRDGGEQSGFLRNFRVTSSDELNLMCGLIEWTNTDPEVTPIDLLSGLGKHDNLRNRGRMILGKDHEGNWVATLRALKYSPAKKYFTLHGVTEGELDELLGHSVRDFLLESGALKFGKKSEIDGDLGRNANQLAMVVAPGDITPLAVAYTVTRALAVIKDFGYEY